MAKSLESYLRTHRRRSGLSQKELAFLLGYKAGESVCRYEWSHRRPPLAILVACEIILRVPPRELFPGIYNEVEALVAKRARELHRTLATIEETPAAARKREVVRAIAFGGITAPSYDP